MPFEPLRGVLAHDLNAPNAPANPIALLIELGNTLFDEAEIAETGGYLPSEAAGVARIVGALVSVFAVLASLGLAVVLICIYIVIRRFASILGNIWIVGGTVAGTLMLTVGWIPSAINNIENGIEERVSHLWSDIETVVGTFSDSHTVKTAPAKIPGHTPDIIAANRAIQHLQSEINHLQGQVEAIAAHSGSDTNVTVNQVPATLPQQLRTLSQNQQRLYRNQVAMNTFEQQLAAEVQAVANHVNALQTQAVTARTVQVGFQEVIAEIHAVIQSERDINGKQDKSISTLTHQVAELSPLLYLLTAGQAGLENLRKLEDDMCQCPQLGDMGNDTGSALAIYEFITNG